ncbi:hypothetical protein Unana1_07596 [Umbelopsis nana]
MLPHIEEITSRPAQIVVYVILFLLALVLLEIGADVFVDSSAFVAKRYHIPQVLIALLTAGAEWEELIVVIAAILQKNQQLALGNIIGSCVSNILGAFSLGIMFPQVLEADRSSKLYGGVLLIFAFLVAGILYGNALRKPAGAVLIALFAIYVGSIAYGIYHGVMSEPEGSDSESDSDTDSESENDKQSETADDIETESKHTRMRRASGKLKLYRVKLKKSSVYHIIALIIGLGLMSVSGWLISGSASAFATYAGLSNTVTGLTIVSIATTLPEKFIAVFSGHRGHTGILVANTVGSNIFILTLVLGIAIVASEPEVDIKTRYYDTSIMLVSSVLLAGLLLSNLLKRWVGFLMFLIYLAYVISNFWISNVFGVSEIDS